MKVSIIIPVYNVEKYIVKCVESVINQDYKGQMECIIVDDATPDDSITLAENLISDYSGRIEFQVIHHETNKGLSAARNTGIMASKGDYIYFLDGDDYLELDCMTSIVSILTKYPNVELVQAGAISVLNGYNLENCKDLPDYTDDRLWIKRAILSRLKIPIASWNKLISKEFIKKYNLYFKEGIIHEDEHWNFFACKYLSSIAFCKKNTYNYVVREGSIMDFNKKLNKRSVDSWLIILKDFIINIDPVCYKEQIEQIFIMLHAIYVFNKGDIKKRSRSLFKELSIYNSCIGKFIINVILFFPRLLNQNKIVYRFINRLYLSTI